MIVGKYVGFFLVPVVGCGCERSGGVGNKTAQSHHENSIPNYTCIFIYFYFLFLFSLIFVFVLPCKSHKY